MLQSQAKIVDQVTQLQADSESVLQIIFAQAGDKIQRQQQLEIQRQFVHTQQILEQFKRRYIQ